MKVEFVNRTRRYFPAADLRRAAWKIFSALQRMELWRREEYAVSLVFVGDAEIRRLNNAFLKKNRPTSILSFDYGDSGELVIAPNVVAREAREARQPFSKTMKCIIAHGALHLAGFHHGRSRNLEKRFFSIEADLLARLGARDASHSLSPRVARRRRR